MFKSSINTEKKGGISMVNIYVYECIKCKKQKRDCEDRDDCTCSDCSNEQQFLLQEILVKKSSIWMI